MGRIANVTKKVSEFFQMLVAILLGFAVALVIGWVIYAVEFYQIDLYKRKYPGTSTADYFLDRK